MKGSIWRKEGVGRRRCAINENKDEGEAKCSRRRLLVESGTSCIGT